VRFLLDMGVSPRVLDWLRGWGHDATHLRDQGLERLSDERIFAKASAENRIVLTFDLDFAEIVSMSPANTSAVVFRLRNTRTDHLIARLAVVLEESAGALQAGAIVSVEDARHRVRSLPIGRVEE
jgi:predicted nuclease of predicted toxin-antitoxin system